MKVTVERLRLGTATASSARPPKPRRTYGEMKMGVRRRTTSGYLLHIRKEERPMERSTNALAELARPLEDIGDFEDTDRR